MHTVKTTVSSSSARSLVLSLSLWAAIVGPLLFVLVFTIDGWLTPGYSAMRDTVSFLELNSVGWLQHFNFLMAGLCFVFFAWGFFTCMRSQSGPGWLVITATLIALSGAGLLMAGIFPPDALGTTQLSPAGKLHAVSFSLVFLPLGLAGLLVGSKFIKRAGWRIYAIYSLLLGLFSSIAALGSFYTSFITSSASNAPISASTSQFAVGGLINRILIIVAFAWYVILASRILRQKGKAIVA